MTAEDRRAFGGAYTELSAGVTHFRLEGPPAGPPIVLLHGATVPLWEFDRLVPELHAAGFRTLRFDLFGHGMSDRPARRYTLELFAEQTIELIEASGLRRPVTLLGHSVGAAIASRVAALRPGWVERLTLVAPMLNFSASTRWTRAFLVPGVGEALMRYFGVPALVRRRRERYASIGRPELTAMFIEQISYAGFAEALLSMVRSQTLGDQTPRYAALSTLEHDRLVIAGACDTVIPAADVAAVCGLVAEHRLVVIDEAEHNLLLTHAKEIAAALCAFALGGPRDGRSLQSTGAEDGKSETG